MSAVPGAVWVTTAAAAGIAAGVPLRAAVFHHAVPAGADWRTACPACGTAVVRPGWRLLASGLRPSGRCGSCGSRIGPLGGAVELTGAAVVGLLVWRLGAHPGTVALVWAGLLGLTLAFVDAAVHRLPDRLVGVALAGTLAALGAAVATGTPLARLVTAVACGLGAGLAYLVPVLAAPGGMGFGDAKLAVLIGLAAGWFGVRVAVYGIVAGVVLAGFGAAALLALRRIGRTDRIAFGPYMLAGALLAITVLG